MDEGVVEPDLSRERKIRFAVYAITSLLGLFYTFSAWQNFSHFGCSIDLAIFDQALWNLSQFQSPESTLRGVPNLFADHLHPAIIVFVPFYWMGIGTQALVLLQPAIVLASVVPIWRFSRRRLSPGTTALITLAFAFSWGVARGVGFDFHELSLSTLVIAWAIELFDTERPFAFAFSILLLLLTKEDQLFTVFMFGIVAMIKRRPRYALPLFGSAAAWYALALKLIMPRLSPSGGYEHWVYGQIAPDFGGLVKVAVTKPGVILTHLLAPKVKVLTALRTFATFGFLSLLSPYALLALPSLVSRMLSSEAVHWEPAFHYSMPVMAILAAAAADGLRRLSDRVSIPRLPEFASGIALVLAFLLNRFGLQREQLLSPRYDASTSRAIDRALDEISPASSVTTDQFVATKLAHRRWLLHADDGRPAYRTDLFLFDPSATPGATRLLQAVRSSGEYDELPSVGPLVYLRRKAGIPSDLPAQPDFANMGLSVDYSGADQSSRAKNRTPGRGLPLYEGTSKNPSER